MWRVGTHISERLLGVIIRVRVPEAAHAHAHALPTLLPDDHLHHKLVARQLQIVLEPILDLVGDLARPLRRQLWVIPATVGR